MSAAARRLPSLAQRQLSSLARRPVTRVAPRIAPRVTRCLQLQRHASTARPAVDPSVSSGRPGSLDQPEKSEGEEPGDEVLKKGASQDPELYVLSTVLLFAFSIAGFYFGRKPTSASSQANVGIADGTMPWEVDDAEDSKDHFKYRYHPGGDKSKPLKDAPSALNVVIIPDVNLPKELHDRFNKWGKDGY